jgi:WD repeat-containing protein 35
LLSVRSRSSDNKHPRLWRILAESALEQLNFLIADKAFVHCSDYQGIQFVKRLKLLSDRNKQRAEVAAYFRRFDEAETLYLQMDCKELAVELRTRLGDWFRVVQLIQSGAGDDSLLNEAYNNIGDYYADRQKWVKAYKFYAKAKNLKQMVSCAYILDDYAALEKLVGDIPVGSDFLKDVGLKFQSVGLCTEAVAAFLKADDPKAAIDACVLLNQWDQAVELAEQHHFQQIEGLLTAYASHLLQKEKLFQAVELYRKANRHTDAAKLLVQLANQAAKSKVQPLRCKKLYTMAAIEVDRFKARMLDQAGGVQQSTMQTLASLMTHDLALSGAGGPGNEGLEDAWHGAEGYHFFLLAQRQLYAGQVEFAMKSALRLTEYEDILESRDIYSIVALASFYNKYYGQCSRAFIKLEGLTVGEGKDQVSKEELERYKQLALSIFTKYPPQGLCLK